MTDTLIRDELFNHRPMTKLSYYDKSPQSLKELINLAVSRINEQIKPDNHVVYLAWQGMFSETVSCSHHAPKGKLTNWGGMKSDIPKSYPGWQGRVWVSTLYSINRHKTFINVMENTGISSGTGGYGLYNLPEWVNINPKFRKLNTNRHFEHYPLSWDSRIFEMDFPELDLPTKKDYEIKKVEYMSKKVAAALRRKYRSKFDYNFPVLKAAYVNKDYVD